MLYIRVTPELTGLQPCTQDKGGITSMLYLSFSREKHITELGMFCLKITERDISLIRRKTEWFIWFIIWFSLAISTRGRYYYH